MPQYNKRLCWQELYCVVTTPTPLTVLHSAKNDVDLHGVISKHFTRDLEVSKNCDGNLS